MLQSALSVESVLFAPRTTLYCSDNERHRVSQNKLYIGTAGWSYADWNGIVYPEARGKGFHPLRWLARRWSSGMLSGSDSRSL